MTQSVYFNRATALVKETGVKLEKSLRARRDMQSVDTPLIGRCTALRTLVLRRTGQVKGSLAGTGARRKSMSGGRGFIHALRPRDDGKVQVRAGFAKWERNGIQ